MVELINYIGKSAAGRSPYRIWKVRQQMPTLNVVVASTRPGRVGYPVAQWFTELATAHGGFDVELVDLAAFDLPLLDEPNHPRLGQYVHQHTLDWSASVAAVTPSCS